MFKFKCNLNEYESCLKVSLGLIKQKNILNWKLKLGVIMFLLGANMLINVLQLKLLLKISIILSVLLVAIIFILSSTKVLKKNYKIIAKLASKKFPHLVYSEKTVEIREGEIIYKVGDNSFTTNLCDVKEIITDEYIIALISSYDKLCAVLPISVFKDAHEKEAFLDSIKDKRDIKTFDEDMDFTYKITTQDYANYLNSYNSHMKIKKNIDKFIKIFLIIACIILVPYFSFQGDMLSGAMFLVGIILVYIMYLYFPTDKQYEKQLINASIKHFKEYPETGNVQQIKLLEDGVIHYSNGLKKKVLFNNIKKAYLTNGTIVAIDTNNTLSFIIPTHVFDSEEKRDKFISLLNKC